MRFAVTFVSVGRAVVRSRRHSDILCEAVARNLGIEQGIVNIDYSLFILMQRHELG